MSEENLTYEWLSRFRGLSKEGVSASSTLSKKHSIIYEECKSRFEKNIDDLLSPKENNDFSPVEWNKYRDVLSESKIRDFVRGRNAVGAQDVGALDVDFTDVGDARGNIKLDPSWVSSNIETVTLSPGNSLMFNKKYARDLVIAYQRACRLTGYCPQQNGGWVPRRSLSSVAKNQPPEQRDIGGHAWGTSFDLLLDKSNPKAIEFANELKKGNPETGTTFIWGGDWEETGEETHFEVNFSGKPPVTTPTGGGLSGAATESGDMDSSTHYGDWRRYFTKSLENWGIKENKARLLKEEDSGRLSDLQVAKLLYDVGFRDEDLVTAVRIVIGESECNPRAVNHNSSTSIDRGLFQFNNLAFPNLSDEDAFDPVKSAQYAFRVYKKVGFKPWSGKTQFHSLKHSDLTPDTNRIERAKNAVAQLTGYVSTGNFEYLPQSGEISTANGGERSFGDWRAYFGKSLENWGIKESKVQFGKKFVISNKSKNKDIMNNKDILFSMLKFYDKELKFELPVKIIFRDDQQNSKKPLGKTGYYHPEETSITIFCTNRLLKDILRSLGHELIHHKQHCLHPFEKEDTSDGYAQTDKRLRRKEKEAYLFGNMLFRDFEDNYKKKHKGVF